MSTTVRHPPPRPLGAAETLESLTHWATTFRTYFKRDDAYKQLIRQSARWNPLEIHYGQATETTGLKRTAAEVKEDLVDLLTTLAGFLPHSYLTDKLLKNTKNWSDVWTTIHEHYGVQVSSETFLDFEDFYKQTGETHRQFYERLLQHARQHLAPANTKVEEVDTGEHAENMSVSLMNMIALQWLRKTDPTLIKIVKTEYSTDLRKNIQLASLVPRIAQNIDSLLARYSNNNACNKVITSDEAMDKMVINKVWGKTQPRGVRTKQEQQSSSASGLRQSRSRGPFCPACYYLSQQLQTSLHFKHLPLDCPRKTVAVNMMKMEDSEYFNDTGKNSDFSISGIYQNDCQVRKVRNAEIEQLQTNKNKSFDFINDEKQLNKNSNTPIISSTAAELLNRNDLSDKSVPDIQFSSLLAAVYKLETRIHNNTIRKEKSPAVPVVVANRPALAIIDEGSEINCLDEELALKLQIQFIPTSCTALAAGSSRMKLVGQTVNDLKLYPQGVTNSLCWNLGKTVIVNNLGVDILLGEPGKVDNRISTVPHRRMIECVGHDSLKVRIPYGNVQQDKNFSLCRSAKTTSIYPGEALAVQVPSCMKAQSLVYIAPRRTNFHSWFAPKVLKVNDNGNILIKNSSDDIVKVKKNEHIADIRSCIFAQGTDLLNPINVRNLYNLNLEDVSI